MNRASLILSFIILLLLSTSGFSSAQSISVDSLDQDTTVIDERKSTFGQNVISPTSVLEPLAYSRFINAQFDASAIFKKNREYTKVEIATIVEKDGSTSIFVVKGIGPAAMKAELVRILKLFPNRIPATKNGKPIRYRVYQPFEFIYKTETINND